MRRKWKRLWWVAGAIAVVTIISWIAVPEWRAKPGGPLLLLAAATVVIVPLIKDLLEIVEPDAKDGQTSKPGTGSNAPAAPAAEGGTPADSQPRKPRASRKSTSKKGSGCLTLDFSIHVTIIVAALIVAAGSLLYASNPAWREAVATAVAQVGAAATATPSQIPSSTPTLKPTPVECLCQKPTDDATARCLIDREAAAADIGSLDWVNQIFAPDAYIHQGDTKKTWSGPDSYYGESFRSFEFNSTLHFGTQPVQGPDANRLYYISGSKGSYTDRSSGVTSSYDNPPPSEHWTFEKDQRSCWVVARYEFNAAHIPFP